MSPAGNLLFGPRQLDPSLRAARAAGGARRRERLVLASELAALDGRLAAVNHTRQLTERQLRESNSDKLRLRLSVCQLVERRLHIEQAELRWRYSQAPR